MTKTLREQEQSNISAYIEGAISSLRDKLGAVGVVIIAVFRDGNDQARIFNIGRGEFPAKNIPEFLRYMAEVHEHIEESGTGYMQ